MRRILELLRLSRRVKNPHANPSGANPSTVNSRSGRAPGPKPLQPKTAQPKAPRRKPDSYRASSAAARGTADRDQAELIAACKRARWQTSEEDGPEFGGLIEPRAVYHSGVMPAPFRESARHDPAETKTPSEDADGHGGGARGSAREEQHRE